MLKHSSPTIRSFEAVESLLIISEQAALKSLFLMVQKLRRREAASNAMNGEAEGTKQYRFECSGK